MLDDELAAHQRPDTFEEMEKADYMPAKFNRDACCIADEGSPCSVLFKLVTPKDQL